MLALICPSSYYKIYILVETISFALMHNGCLAPVLDLSCCLRLSSCWLSQSHCVNKWKHFDLNEKFQMVLLRTHLVKNMFKGC